MRRLSLLLPLWLALTVGEHSVVHQCPTHAMPPAAAPVATEHAHGHHADAPPADTGHGDHGCLCIDACSTATAAVPGFAPESPRAAIALVADRRIASPGSAPRANRQFRLPWANGPPTPANIG